VSLDPDAEPAVLVRIFGEPSAEGGPGLPPGTPLAIEIIAYVALRGAVSPRALAAAVWPYGVTPAERDATLSRVRDWLGESPDGRSRLRLDDDGRLRLAEDVQLDWHLFVALAARGADADVLRALELAGGPLVEPHLPRRYTWIAREPVAREMPAYVVDVAHRLAVTYLVRREWDGAVAAARAWLRVEPVAEVLWEDMVVAAPERDGAGAAERMRGRRRSPSASRATYHASPREPERQPPAPAQLAAAAASDQPRGPRVSASTSSTRSSSSSVIRPAATCPRSITTCRIVLRSASDCLAIFAASS